MYQQPQTCSRLFRPWDGQDSTVSSSTTPPRITSTSAEPNSLTNEHSPRMHEWASAEDQSRLSEEDSESERCSDSDVEIKVTDEGDRPRDQLKSQYTSAITTSLISPALLSPVDPAHLYHLQYIEQQALYYGLQPYFGLEHAVSPLLNTMAITGSSSMAMTGPSMDISTNGMAGGSMDAMAMGAMSHEYARVMAEEAQAKLMSARKQRPKKFKCTYCDVAFSNNGQLKGHVRIHTGERPFKCDDTNCGKTFTRNEELTRHKRIHTGQRPYKCQTCGKAFGRRDHLKKHTKTHLTMQDQYYGTPGAFFLPNHMHYSMYGC